MLGAVGFTDQRTLGAELEILVAGMADRPFADVVGELAGPAGGLGSRARSWDTRRMGVAYARGAWGAGQFHRVAEYRRARPSALDGRGACRQMQAMRLADHRVFRDAQTLADFGRREAFAPQPGQLGDLFGGPIHCPLPICQQVVDNSSRPTTDSGEDPGWSQAFLFHCLPT